VIKNVGILGGGQLGKMIAESVYKLGGCVNIYDPDKNAPARHLAARFFNNEWTDTQALAEFFAASDVVTYEFENVESEGIARLQQEKPIFPSVSVLQTTQHRLREKKFLQQSDLPHAAFVEITSVNDLQNHLPDIGYPCILKSSRGGYDGKGQLFIRSHSDLQTASAWIEKAGAAFQGVLEEALDLAMEASCIVGRGADGEEVVFPVFENTHKNHILDLTLVPAGISAVATLEVKRMALRATELLGVKGLLTTEFFLSRKQSRNSQATIVDGWYIYINEFAPRPHNSGHVTRNACTLSQFDALARILMQVPIGEPRILAPGAFCMGQLLGDVWLAQKADGPELDLSAWRAHPAVIDVVIYGKHEPRSGRKMGHFVTFSDTTDDAVENALAFRQALAQPVNLGKTKAPARS
jgi:5-(carboxyamino)imidazole ribonucleotide synthase